MKLQIVDVYIKMLCTVGYATVERRLLLSKYTGNWITKDFETVERVVLFYILHFKTLDSI